MAKYLEILFSHRVRFLILLLVLPAALAGGSIFAFRTADAAAAMWIEAPAYIDTSAVQPAWNQYLTPAQNQLDTVQQVLQTHSFITELGRRLWNAGTVQNVSEMNGILDNLPKQLKVTAEGSHLISLAYTCSRPQVCLGVLQNTIDLYHEGLARTQRDQTTLARSVLTGQIQDAETARKGSESALQTWLVSHPGVALADSGGNPELDLLVHQAEANRKQVNDLQDRLTTVNVSSAGGDKVVRNLAAVVDPPRVINRGLIGGKSAITRTAMIVGGCWAAAVLYILLLAWLDQTAKDGQELKRRLDVAVLVTVPRFAEMKEF